MFFVWLGFFWVLVCDFFCVLVWLFFAFFLVVCWPLFLVLSVIYAVINKVCLCMSPLCVNSLLREYVLVASIFLLVSICVDKERER